MISQRFSRYLSVYSVCFATVCLGGQLFSQCPQISKTNPHWAKNAKVYYSFSGMADPMKSELQSAVDLWNAENQANGSNVTFVAGTPPGGASVSTPSLIFDITAGDTTSPPAAISGNGPGFYYATTRIVINYGSSAYDSGQPGYGTIFLKVGLHEIGHGMGLQDTLGTGEQSEQSVMNHVKGTNDSGKNMPTSVQPCDRNAITSSNSPYAEVSGGSGHGGPGTGTTLPCTQTYLYIYTPIYSEFGTIWVLSEVVDLGCV